MNLTTKTVYEPCLSTDNYTNYIEDREDAFKDTKFSIKRENVYVLTPEEMEKFKADLIAQFYLEHMAK